MDYPQIHPRATAAQWTKMASRMPVPLQHVLSYLWSLTPREIFAHTAINADEHTIHGIWLLLDGRLPIYLTPSYMAFEIQCLMLKVDDNESQPLCYIFLPDSDKMVIARCSGKYPIMATGPTRQRKITVSHQLGSKTRLESTIVQAIEIAEMRGLSREQVIEKFLTSSRTAVVKYKFLQSSGLTW